MIVHVLIGVPRPDKVQVEAVVAALPHGRTTVQVVGGGLERLNADGSDGTLIVNAIITVSVDDGTEGRCTPHLSALPWDVHWSNRHGRR
jgi:hypothetical protein